MNERDRLRTVCEDWLRAAVSFLSDKEVPNELEDYEVTTASTAKQCETGVTGETNEAGELWEIRKIIVPDYGSLVSYNLEGLAQLPEADQVVTVLSEIPAAESILFTNDEGLTVPAPRRKDWLHHEHLFRFVVAYLDRVGPVVFLPEHFEVLFRQFEQLIFAPESIEAAVLINVQNLATELPPVPLAPDVYLRGLTQEERKDAVAVFAGHGAHPSFVVPEAFLEVRRRVTDTREAALSKVLISAAHEAAPTTLLALRLLKAEAVGPGAVYFRCDNVFLAFPAVPQERLASSQQDLARGNERYLLAEDVAQALPDLYEKAKQLVTDQRILLARTRLDDSHSRFRLEDKLVDYWIALETLFAHDGTQELKFRATLRIARLIGESKEERLQLFEELKASYTLRSDVVHGGDPGSKKRQGLPEVVDQTGEALRRSLRWCLDHGTSPRLQDIDQQFLA